MVYFNTLFKTLKINLVMKKINSHEDLKVWKKSIDLVKETYNLIKSFPQHEIYVLVTQMKRAALSVACNT